MIIISSSFLLRVEAHVIPIEDLRLVYLMGAIDQLID